MQYILNLKVSISLEIELDEPKEAKQEARAMSEYLTEDIKEHLSGKWQGAATVESVDVVSNL